MFIDQIRNYCYYEKMKKKRLIQRYCAFLYAIYGIMHFLPSSIAISMCKILRFLMQLLYKCT